MRDHLFRRRPRRPYRFALALTLGALALLVAGCSGVVTIVEPSKSGAVAAAPTFRVQIGSNYTGAFSADLDGTPITGSFTPAAAASTTVTASVSSCYNGPSHELIARANSISTGGGIVIDNDVADFNVPSLQFNPVSGAAPVTNMTPGQSVSVTVNFTVAPGVSWPVLLTPNSTRVSVGGQPAGAAFLMTMPSNNVGSFTVTAVAPGPFAIAVNARGYQCVAFGGSVK